jgi:hypothetical protein
MYKQINMKNLKLLLIGIFFAFNFVEAQGSLYKQAIKSASSYNASPTYDTYELNIFKVIDDTVNGQLSANTGLAFDENRNKIYSGVTPITGTTTGIFIFSPLGVYEGQLPIVSVQGFDYHPIDDQFIVWSQGGAASTLKTYDYDGTLVYTQSNFDPFGNGTQSGSVCINYDLNELLLSSDGVTDIVVMVKSGNDWVFDRLLGATNPQEGVAYDSEDGTIWYNQLTEIVNITRLGVEIKRIPQTAETTNVNEGLAINTIRKTMLINSDKYAHGGIINGNRCIEVNHNY